jgi:hypothetical protein
MSDNAKLQAITDGIHQAYDVGLEDTHQVHVFSNSLNTLHLTMDMSHYLGQHLFLSICKVWCLGSDTIQITLSTSTTSLMAWTWKIIKLCTYSAPQLRKDTPLVLTHVNSGLWMHKVGHSHSLTTHLV